MMNQSYDKLFKIILVGDSGVGKSSLLLRYCEDSYSESFISTIGVDFKIKNVEIDKKLVKLQLWDTAGQERFRTITASYYRGAQGMIIVFDVCERSTFENVTHWIEQIRNMQTDKSSIMLIGNKVDDTERRQVSSEEATEFCRTHGLIKYIETSAKKSIGVEEAFRALTETLLASNTSAQTKKRTSFVTAQAGRTSPHSIFSWCMG